MATDPNKKTLRHFQCRDYLWETFEQMSAELECSVDYLINEAMRQYARSRNYAGRGQSSSGNIPVPPTTGGGDSQPSPTIPPGAPGARAVAPPMNRRPPSTPGIASVARPGTMPSVPTMPGGVAAPRIPSLPAAAPMPAARAPGTPALPLNQARPGAPAPPLPAQPRPSVPPALPPGAPSRPMGGPGGPASSPGVRVPAIPSSPPPPQRAAPPAAEPPAPVLTALYQGQRYPITNDEFVIGRGQKTSDLVIKDSNVSRRHAVVVRHNGQYWIVDQQSTNGVEFMGAKIERKRIDDGDIFKICDYEIVFTYQ